MEYKKKELIRDMGDRLANWRKTLGWSQEEAAERAGISQQALSNAENGKTMLMPDTMLKLCIAYKMSADYLLTGEVADTDHMILDKKVRVLDTERFFHLSGIVDHYLAAVGCEADGPENTETAK